MKQCHQIKTHLIETHEDFKRFATANYAALIERAISLNRRLLREKHMSISNIAYEKLLLRESFQLVENFIHYCPSQLPCRPALLLDSFILHYFGKPHDMVSSMNFNPLIYKLLNAFTHRAVLSKDALTCLPYHLYGLKPRKISNLLGIPDDQIQRIYKNFARWRQTGWEQTVEEAGLTTGEVQKIIDIQANQPQYFYEQTQEIVGAILTFYRKSDPPHYPCLSILEWEKMVSEGYGFDYRSWHLPLCTTCLNVVSKVCDDYSLSDVSLKIHIFPHSHTEHELPQRKRSRNKNNQLTRMGRKRSIPSLTVS